MELGDRVVAMCNGKRPICAGLLELEGERAPEHENCLLKRFLGFNNALCT